MSTMYQHQYQLRPPNLTYPNHRRQRLSHATLRRRPTSPFLPRILNFKSSSRHTLRFCQHCNASMLPPSSLTPKISHEPTEVVEEVFEVAVAEDGEEEEDSILYHPGGRRSRVMLML